MVGEGEELVALDRKTENKQKIRRGTRRAAAVQPTKAQTEEKQRNRLLRHPHHDALRTLGISITVPVTANQMLLFTTGKLVVCRDELRVVGTHSVHTVAVYPCTFER